MYAAYRGAGHRSRPTLQPIAVGEPFEQVGVDIEMPRTERENRYIVVLWTTYMTNGLRHTQL